jgi:photosystem II stability/assembly factor-like uncharacterized protein
VTHPCRAGLRRTCPGRARLCLFTLVLLLTFSAPPAQGHDPSAWGGLFRSRDYGATWVSANRGTFLSGAIALAISPVDPDHLLLGTESGLMRSRNGGRDWTIEAPTIVLGSVFAVAFDADGQRALIATGLGIFRSEAENSWREAPAPRGASPARAIIRGREAGRAYLAGWTGLYRSDDWGASWSDATDGLPQEPPTALVVTQDGPETLYTVVQGKIWMSIDGAHGWSSRGLELSSVSVDSLTADWRHPARLWAAGSDGLFRSNDGGANWQRIGQAFPEPDTIVNGIAASDEAVVATTSRGIYRSVRGGENWRLITDIVPSHLGAGPLLRDPSDPASLYAGFALIPYRELWQRTADRNGGLARVGAGSLVGGGVLLLLVTLVAVTALRRLGRYYRPARKSAPSMRSVEARQFEKGMGP